jgi:hypothetical protein
MTMIIPWKQSKYLVCTSGLFLIPAYDFWHCSKLLSSGLIITSFISINYWRNACDSYRRCLDLFFSKIAFCVYFTIGMYNAKKNILYYILLSIAVGISFNMSNTLYFRDSSNFDWVYSHIIFHLLLCYQMHNAYSETCLL